MLCAKTRDLSANKHSDHLGVFLSFCYLARLPGSTVCFASSAVPLGDGRFSLAGSAPN